MTKSEQKSAQYYTLKQLEQLENVLDLNAKINQLLVAHVRSPECDAPELVEQVFSIVDAAEREYSQRRHGSHFELSSLILDEFGWQDDAQIDCYTLH